MKKTIGFVLAVAVTAAVMAPAVCAQDYYYKKAVTVDSSAKAAAEELTGERDVYAERDSKTGFWLIGGGAMVNRLPLSASEFTLPMLYFAYESIYKKAMGPFDFSWSIGFYDLMPEIEAAVFLPMKPFDLRISVGGYYDFIIGGHAGMLLKTGIVLNKYAQFDLLFVPFGTQPTISYSELLKTGNKVDYDGTNGLKFPLFGALVSIRI
jgi:hypothetical protein